MTTDFCKGFLLELSYQEKADEFIRIYISIEQSRMTCTVCVPIVVICKHSFVFEKPEFEVFCSTYFH